MSYKLFLDDIRIPANAGYYDEYDWLVVRSVEDAKDVVLDLGWPNVISFDHDLGDNMPTGKDFANWLVELDLENGSMPQDFKFEVHSANPVGAENIRSVLNNYLSFRKTEK